MKKISKKEFRRRMFEYAAAAYRGNVRPAAGYFLELHFHKGEDEIPRLHACPVAAVLVHKRGREYATKFFAGKWDYDSLARELSDIVGAEVTDDIIDDFVHEWDAVVSGDTCAETCNRALEELQR